MHEIGHQMNPVIGTDPKLGFVGDFTIIEAEKIITRIHNLDEGRDDVHGQDKVEEVMNMNIEHVQNLVGGGQGDEHEHVQSSVVFGGGDEESGLVRH